MWEMIIPLILNLIASCLDNDPEAIIVKRLQHRSPLVVLAFTRSLRKETKLRGRELRELRDEWLQAAKMATPAELKELVAEAAATKE